MGRRCLRQMVSWEARRFPPPCGSPLAGLLGGFTVHQLIITGLSCGEELLRVTDSSGWVATRVRLAVYGYAFHDTPCPGRGWCSHCG